MQSNRPQPVCVVLSRIVGDSLRNRYGAGGSQATMQWIKEHDIKFDSALYTKMQQMIEAGRNDFANSQRKMIDVRREYEASLNFFWRGTWLKVAGYPKLDMKEYQPVITGRVETTFVNGKEDAPLKLR